MRAVKDLIRWAYLAAFSDGGESRGALVTDREKDSQVSALAPYGFTHNPPPGSIGLMFQVNGDEGNRVAIFDFPQARLKILKNGEVAIYSVHGQYILLRKDGHITMIAPQGGDVYVEADNIQLNARNRLDLRGDTVKIHADTSYATDIAGYAQRFTHMGGANFDQFTWYQGAVINTIVNNFSPPEAETVPKNNGEP